jgi:hypothetical protein
MDGSNASFTIAHSPSPAASVILTRNGLVQKPGIDFSMSAATISFAPASLPQAGDLLQVWYRY